LPGSNPVKTGDSWLAKWIPILTSGPDYTSGHLPLLGAAASSATSDMCKPFGLCS
jgi:hypothetical protein